MGVRALPASLRCVLRLRHINPSLVLVQPGKTRPDITEQIVDWDVKNQIKQTKILFAIKAIKVHNKMTKQAAFLM